MTVLTPLGFAQQDAPTAERPATILTPLGFAQRYAVTSARSVTIVLIGAGAFASAGEVTTQTSEKRALSALGFNTQPKDFQRAGGSVEVFLVGAQALALGQSLLGANVTIIPDGAGLTASAGGVRFDNDVGVDIVNLTAEARALSGSEIDDITGFRLLPRKSVRDWRGYRTRSESADRRHPQEYIESRGNRPQTGSQSPEDDDIDYVPITPDDL